MAEIYAVTGATGHTGKVVTEILRKHGKKVRIMARNVAKMQILASQGVEIMPGDLTDLKFLQQAFRGVQAVYALIPPNFQADDFRHYQNKITDTLLKAIETSKVRYVVTLSSVGAHLHEKGGLVQGLYDMEQKFNRVKGLNVLHLRPTIFMENLFGQIEMIRQMGIVGSPIKGDLQFPIVATPDIGQQAAQNLLDLNFTGNTIQYVLGPRDVTYKEIATVLGKAIGKPELSYVEFSYADTKMSMMKSMGLSAGVAQAMVEFMQSMNEGRILSDIKRDVQNTTPTSLEQFAQIFAQIYTHHSSR